MITEQKVRAQLTANLWANGVTWLLVGRRWRCEIEDLKRTALHP